MQITSRTEYSVRALCELCFSQEPLSIRKISEAQKLPVKYLEHLFRELKSKGLVKSISGAKGGYVLNKSVKDISLLDVVMAVEAFDESPDCVKRENSEYCIGKPCGFHQVWQEIDQHMHHYYAGISLDYICSKIKER